MDGIQSLHTDMNLGLGISVYWVPKSYLGAERRWSRLMASLSLYLLRYDADKHHALKYSLSYISR